MVRRLGGNSTIQHLENTIASYLSNKFDIEYRKGTFLSHLNRLNNRLSVVSASVKRAATMVMFVGSKAQLKSLNVDEFISNHEGTCTPLLLVANAKDLGMSIYCVPCATALSKYVSPFVLLRRLRSILSSELLLRGSVSQTFCEISKIISRKYTIPEITFMMRISS